MELIPNEPKLFELPEFADKIRLSDNVLYHLSDIIASFEDYLKLINECTNGNNIDMLYYWLDEAEEELISSCNIEKHKFVFSNKELMSGDLFFESLNISQKRIKDIHKFICEHSDSKSSLVGEYRKKPAWVGNVYQDGSVEVKWWGANIEDIEKFMKSYIEFYKKNSLKEIHANPFLKAALSHLLFVKIHPFGDGNGRVSRIIQNLSFTSGINRVYDTNLKLSPLNISTNIHMNQITYVRRINDIPFSIKDFNNDAVNRWLDFVLSMYDEQIHFQTEKLKNTQIESQNKAFLSEAIINQSEKSKINKLFK